MKYYGEKTIRKLVEGNNNSNNTSTSPQFQQYLASKATTDIETQRYIRDNYQRIVASARSSAAAAAGSGGGSGSSSSSAMMLGSEDGMEAYASDEEDEEY